MRILVCGGRDFANPIPYDHSEENKPRMDQYKFVQRTLDKIAVEFSKMYDPNDNWLPTDITIVEGNAIGTDRAAGDWAVCNYARNETYPANWNEYGKKAGPIRNRLMLSTGIDLVIAFPGGSGTAHMVKIAKQAGVEVREIAYTI